MVFIVLQQRKTINSSANLPNQVGNMSFSEVMIDVDYTHTYTHTINDQSQETSQLISIQPESFRKNENNTSTRLLEEKETSLILADLIDNTSSVYSDRIINQLNVSI